MIKISNPIDHYEDVYDEELGDYQKPIHVQGYFVVSSEPVSELSELLYTGDHPTISGARTYCYKFDDKSHYEELYPPESAEEPPVDVAVPEYDLEAGKAGIKSVLNDTYNKLFKAAKGDYPEMEVLTWATKLEESLRYINGEGSDYIDGISSKRGENPEDFANKVLRNNKAYQSAITNLENMRMTFDVKIANAESEADITEIYKELGGLA